jgi:hypothetical protein
MLLISKVSSFEFCKGVEGHRSLKRLSNITDGFAGVTITSGSECKLDSFIGACMCNCVSIGVTNRRVCMGSRPDIRKGLHALLIVVASIVVGIISK